MRLPKDRRFQIAQWDSIKQPFDLIINATSLSLTGDQVLLNKDLVNSNTVAYDMFYSQETTTFNSWATSAGSNKTFDGLGMLIHQAALSFELWRQVVPDTLTVLNLLEKKHLQLI